MKKPLSTFIIYAREDGEALKELKNHLKPLERCKDLYIWYDGVIPPGAEWEVEVQEKLNSADIILLLISSYFFNSDYIFDIELPKAIERYNKKNCRIIPIIITDCYWEKFEIIKKLQILPPEGKPIITDGGRCSHALLKQVALGIQESANDFRELQALQVQTVVKKMNVEDDYETENDEEVLKKNIHQGEIIKKIRHASFQLENWKSEFKNVAHSHINRPETTEIISWINSTLPRDERGIALLVGDAGTGKSVILKDVFQELNSEEIPVLGIKADQYCADTIEALENKLHLKEGIEEIVKALCLENELVVILIDQIDALSQSLSVRREFLNTFTHLIRILLDIPEVRIVVSCRTYDLQNDQDFSFYRRQKHFKVGKLSEEQVKSILQKLPAETKNLPTDLLNLLQTPLHLDIFCRIYRSGLSFQKIKVLRDLYEEFWFQKVDEVAISAEQKIVPEKIRNLIFKIALAIYERQNLAVPERLFRSQFYSELTYLKSSGVTVPSREGLTFFHQTFYDFAFAKQFVESKIPVEKYLLDNGQNLHIRSCLKMMVEFLRERDPLEYLRIIKLILTSSEFYFHIKSLVLSLVGFVEYPTGEEMELARELIFPEQSLFKAFLSSVKSREWLLFLFSEKQPQRLIEHSSISSENMEEEVKRQKGFNKAIILDGLLGRHLPESTNEVLEFLTNLAENQHKHWLVQGTLRQINSWENPLATKLFDTYSPQFIDVFIFDFLKKASETNFSWAFEHLKKAIEKTIQQKESSIREIHFEHSLSELISHFAKYYPEPTFEMLLTFQVQQLFKPEEIGKIIAPNIIFSDFPWFSVDFDEDDRDHTGLFYQLINCIRILAKNTSPKFESYINENIKSTSATKLLILVEGFRANPSEYSNEIATFFPNFFNQNGHVASETLSWRARQLLKESYPYFSSAQKHDMLKLVSAIESEREKEWAEENGKPIWIGQVRFTWMQNLPESDFAQISELEEMYLELARRFPNTEDKEPNKIKMSWIGPPMEKSEYEKMTLIGWKESFNKYNENYTAGWGTDKGGMSEHAQQFEAEVKKRPDFFYPLIKELATSNDYPSTYLSYGLHGLKEAKFNSGLLLELVKQVSTNLDGLENWEIVWLVGILGSFANDKFEDDFIVHFLVKIVTTSPDPSDDSLRFEVKDDNTESVFTFGYNTARGSAAHLLPYFYYFKKHENLLFETMENIAENDLLAVRCQLMPRLALMTNLDKERSLKLFLRLIRDNEDVIMERSTWSAQYLTRQNFEGMKPYFKKAITHPKLHKDVAIILALTWVFEKDDALSLLNEFMEISENAKAGSIEVAARNIRGQNGELISRSVELFERFLEDSNEEVIEGYDLAFRYLKPDDFPHLLSSLNRFASTVIARKNPRPFYEFLIECATTYPEACLELMENFADYDKPDIRYNSYYDKEPLKVVINAYNALWGRKMKDHETLKKALLLFDRMLQDDRFRRDAETVLVEVEK